MTNFNFSVLMSIYVKEAPSNLDSCFESLHVQSVQANEIILVLDGPIGNGLLAIIDKWSLLLPIERICLPENVGLGKALNIGLKHCTNELVARMDTDDIATPERFKWQAEFMLANPDIAVSSGFIEEWNTDFSQQLSSRTLPLTHYDIVKFAKMRSPISHPACIFRKSLVLEVGGYPDIYPEDHLLWVRVLQAGYKLANIPQVLLRMRTGENFITRRGYKFLKGELKSYRTMHESNFLTWNEFIKVSVLRSLVRLSPDFLKKWLYKKMR